MDTNYILFLNKSWKQLPSKQQLYGHLPPIKKPIQVRRTRHPGHCWSSKDEHLINVLLWTLKHGHTSFGQPARTWSRQLCTDTGCSLEDLPGVMDNRDGWRERVAEICALSVT